MASAARQSSNRVIADNLRDPLQSQTRHLWLAIGKVAAGSDETFRLLNDLLNAACCEGSSGSPKLRFHHQPPCSALRDRAND